MALFGTVTTSSITNAGTLALSATGANSITLATNGSTRITTTSAGDVGINTTSPGQKLDVNGSINTNTSIITPIAIVGTNPASAGTLRLPSGAQTIRFRNAANNADVPFMGLDSSNEFEIMLGAGSSSLIRFYSQGYGQQPLTIKPAGIAVSGVAEFSSTIGVGNATPSASGAGITFPATQSASTNANTLDDYEEGTFTPAFAFSTSGSVTYAANGQVGYYTKIGNTVRANIGFVLSGISSPTGDVTVTGLPFANQSSANNSASASLGIIRGFASAGLPLRAYTAPTETFLVLSKNDTNAGFTFLAGSDLTASVILFLTIVYQTA
jgi:hypothetical protein